MSLEGWIFMVGLRVFDIGALILWLVWFFKLRDDDEDDSGGDDQGGGGGPPEPEPRGPGGLQAPLPDAGPWPQRRRDGHGDRRPATRPGRPPIHRPRHAPARVRRPASPGRHRVR
jgi:hypothetical protein